MIDFVKKHAETRNPIANLSKDSVYIPNNSGVRNHVPTVSSFNDRYMNYLGYIAGGVTASGEHSLGSISIPAGTFNEGDELFFVVEGNGIEVTGNILLTAGANTLTFASGFNASSISAIPLGFQGYARQQYVALGTNASTRGVMHANGVSNSTSGSHRIVAGTMPSNWITGAFTITLKGGGNDVTKSYIMGRFWRVPGFTGNPTVIDGDL